jgi:hypothetical protein
VLLFELFPLFVAIVVVLAAVSLFVADRKSRTDPDQREERPVTRRVVSPSSAPERPGRRPSMAP